MADTYVLTTNIGKLRLNIQDTEVTDEPRWHDTELQVFLDEAAGAELTSALGLIYLAASMALMAEASDAARLANTIKLGPFGDNEAQVYKSLMESAKQFRLMSGAGYYGNPPLREFRFPQQDQSDFGTMVTW